MKKPKITSGSWKVKRYSNSQPYIGSNVGGAICDIIQYRSKSNANAKAIVTAVNETYHKGINPEAVEDMKEALEKAHKAIRHFVNNRESKPLWKAEVEIKEALKKAGVNLNEKAE